MLSSAMERSGAHRRIALSMVHLFGGASGRRLVFGFMAASALLSMWISNTATTLMLLPIVMAVVEKATDDRLRIALLLGVAYAASVGGVGTPVGTPPNLIFLENYRTATGIDVTFTTWMTWALPVVLTMIPLTGLWLTRGLGSQTSITLPKAGKWRTEEFRTLAVFAVTALLWITRKEPFGGWSGALNLPSATDASIALLAVVAMFLIPNGRNREKLLDWETAVRIPWGILILFGAGIAISKAFLTSGLSDLLGNQLVSLCELPPLLMVTLICLAVTFLTEVTSNTATSNLLMPILAAAATQADIDHRLLMVPATISASFAFMLPVATGPNAIIFGSNQLTRQTNGPRRPRPQPHRHRHHRRLLARHVRLKQSKNKDPRKKTKDTKNCDRFLRHLFSCLSFFSWFTSSYSGSHPPLSVLCLSASSTRMFSIESSIGVGTGVSFRIACDIKSP